MTNCASSKISIQTKSSGCAQKSCGTCVSQTVDVVQESVSLVADEYVVDDSPWVIGFSGGKDSSALLKIVFEALSAVGTYSRPVHVVYCDTGVEIPIMNRVVLDSLQAVERQARTSEIPVTVHVARPKLTDRYFVKVIGRGYPPPTNKFRWCTDKLRINPVHEILKNVYTGDATILLGTRWDESLERARTMRRLRHPTRENFFRHTKSGTQVFAPIARFSLSDVWNAIFKLREPHGIDAHRLAKLYKDAGSECPIFREEAGTPCGSGRFGCWTCTVVRKDKAVASLIEEGYEELSPLFSFRNWLIGIRDQPEYRCRRRRNGAIGLGPFTISARKMILAKLRTAQKRSGLALISDAEIREIHRLWKSDRHSPIYIES